MDHAALNRILEARVKDLAGKRPPRNRADHEKGLERQREILARTLGLYPEPPRTELNAQVTGTLQRDGYRVEKLRYESRKGVLVTAHLYLPEGEGPFPLVLSPHGHFQYKKSTPVVQALGIGLAALGFACLLVDSPGYSWDDNEQNERRVMGTHDDPWLTLGAPVQGQYVWDLVRGLDYCEARKEIDAKRVGVTGASGGGTATMYAFAYDPRIQVAVPVCAATSMEIMPNNGCFCNHLPGVMEIGDRSDVLAMRAPSPLCLIGASDDPEFPLAGHQKTFEKLQTIYKGYKAQDAVRLEIIEGQHDYNRRMREAAYAFFAEHLKGQPRRQHVPEPRPLTDGQTNPYEAGTEKHDSPELLVTAPADRQTKTMRSVLEEGLREPHPKEFVAEKRIAPWAKYGPAPFKVAMPDLILMDSGSGKADDHTLELRRTELNIRMLIYLGLSPAEFLAQILHMHLPGKPETWESDALTGDALSSMIASVRTLVKSAEPADPVKLVKAVGNFSSLVAMHFQLLRPGIEIDCTYQPTSWLELYETQDVGMLQPAARYLKWPFTQRASETPEHSPPAVDL